MTQVLNDLSRWTLLFNNLMNSSENLLSASSGGRGSQVKGRRRVYSIGLLPWSTSTETLSLQSLSLSPSLCLSQPGLSVLSRPLWPPGPGVSPPHAWSKDCSTAVSGGLCCNTVWLNIYSAAAAGLRMWMDDMSDTDISQWNSIFIFQRALGMSCNNRSTLAGPRVCVFFLTDPLYLYFKSRAFWKLFLLERGPYSSISKDLYRIFYSFIFQFLLLLLL